MQIGIDSSLVEQFIGLGMRGFFLGDLLGEDLATPSPAAALLLRDEQGRLVQKGPLLTWLDVVEAVGSDHHDALGDIVGVRVRHPEVSRQTPDEIEVLSDQLVESSCTR